MKTKSPKHDISNKISYLHWIVLVCLAIMGIALGYGSGMISQLRSTTSNEVRAHPNKVFITRQTLDRSGMYVKASYKSDATADNIRPQQSPSKASKELQTRRNSVFKERHRSADTFSSVQPYTRQKRTNSQNDLGVATLLSDSKILAPFSSSETLDKNWQKFAVKVRPDGRPMIAVVFDDLGVI